MMTSLSLLCEFLWFVSSVSSLTGIWRLKATLQHLSSRVTTTYGRCSTSVTHCHSLQLRHWVAASYYHDWTTVMSCCTAVQLVQLEMWAISDALPHEAAQAPSSSACQVSAQSSDERLSYCHFTKLHHGSQRGVVGTYQIVRGHRSIIGPTCY